MASQAIAAAHPVAGQALHAAFGAGRVRTEVVTVQAVAVRGGPGCGGASLDVVGVQPTGGLVHTATAHQRVSRQAGCANNALGTKWIIAADNGLHVGVVSDHVVNIAV